MNLKTTLNRLDIRFKSINHFKSAKMMSRNVLSVLLIFFLAIGANAQSSKLKQAKRMMDNLNYIQAIEIYNQVLEKNDVAEAKINIAEAYRKIGDAGNGEFWYGQVVRLAEAEPIAKLHYGQMLQRNGKCELAREWYNQYIEAVPDDLRGQYLSRACDYEQELMTKGAGIFEVKHLDFNSDLDDFGPNYYGDGIIFASDRDKGSMVKREHGWTGQPFLELYYSEAKETEKGEDGMCGEFVYARPEKFGNKLNSKYHDAVVTFAPGGKEIFFTRNNIIGRKVGKDDEGYVRLKVYSASEVSDGKFGNLESLPFNSDEYSVAHPALSPDGNTLYFASDMPGGFGDMDIYLSKKESGRWGPPENLGPAINSEGREVFPFMDINNRLYYSSDGLIGLGGLDIFYTTEKVPGEWSIPENVGFPINTISDDLGVIFNEAGTCGYFASNRAGGVGGDDIYSFKKVAVPVEVYVYDSETDEPIEGAVVLEDCNGRELVTGEDGTAIIEMKLAACCNFNASADGYNENEEEACTNELENGRVEIPLEPSLKYSLEGIVFDDGTGLPMEGAVIEVTDDCDGDPIDTYITDNSGRFQFDLKGDCCYAVKGSKQRYLADMKENLCTADGESPEAVKLFLSPTVYPPDVTPPPGPGGEDNDDENQGDPYTNINKPEPQFNKDPIYKDEDGLWRDQTNGELADGYITIAGEEVLFQKGDAPDDFELTPTRIPAPDPQRTEGGTIPYLVHIYYDFDQSYIRDDAKPELEQLYTTMTMNPEIIIELGSHTDARGSKSYNKRLSQRRAEAVVKWLVSKGIARDRMVPVGYGETMTVNGCKDFIPCSERDHQLNRRTEFRVIGCKNCADKTEKIISQPSTSMKIDECSDCPF